MQVVQAGVHKLLLLELEQDVIAQIAQQLDLDCDVQDDPRALTLEFAATGREGPLLLFDAADPANLGWFSRCQFYVDGQTAAVLQTPFLVANRFDATGRAVTNALRLQIQKELPSDFRLPGRNPVSEQSVYAILLNFLSALLNTGVAVCGGPLVRPLAGRDAEGR